MQTLETYIADNMASSANTARIKNLEVIVDAHTERDVEFTKFDEDELSCSLAISGDGQCSKIDRNIGTILHPFSLPLPLLVEFSKGCTVLDFGCGISDFLDHFPKSNTIAVDNNDAYIAHQIDKGHVGVQACELNCTSVEPGSVAVLNASYSEPF